MTRSRRAPTCLVTGGGRQSNHARITAAAARRIGLDCHLVLAGRPTDDRHDGNLLLDQLLGATCTSPGVRLLRASRPSIDRARRAACAPMGTSPVRDPGRRRVGDGRASPTSPPSRSCATQFGDRSRLDRRGRRLRRHPRRSARRTRRDSSAHACVGVDVGTRPDLEAVVPRAGARRRGAARAGRAEPHRDRRSRPRRRGLRRAVRRVPGGDPTGRAHRGHRCSTPCTRGRRWPRCSTRLRDGRIGAGDSVVFWATGGQPGALRAPLRGRSHRFMTRETRVPEDPRAVFVRIDGTIRRRHAPCTRRRRRAPRRSRGARASSRGIPFRQEGDDRHSIRRPRGLTLPRREAARS